MTSTARITSKRQITIPASVFSSLGLSQGDTLLIEVVDNRLIMQRPENVLKKLGGSLKRPQRFEGLSLNEIIVKAKQEYFSSKKQA